MLNRHRLVAGSDCVLDAVVAPVFTDSDPVVQSLLQTGNQGGTVLGTVQVIVMSFLCAVSGMLNQSCVLGCGCVQSLQHPDTDEVHEPESPDFPLLGGLMASGIHCFVWSFR